MKQTTPEHDERERRVAEVMWDVLSQLGYEDGSTSAEHQAAFMNRARIEELARAAYIVVGRVMVSESR